MIGSSPNQTMSRLVRRRNMAPTTSYQSGARPAGPKDVPGLCATRSMETAGGHIYSEMKPVAPRRPRVGRNRLTTIPMRAIVVHCDECRSASRSMEERAERTLPIFLRHYPAVSVPQTTRPCKRRCPRTNNYLRASRSTPDVDQCQRENAWLLNRFSSTARVMRLFGVLTMVRTSLLCVTRTAQG